MTTPKTIRKLADLTPDARNVNLGTKRGLELLEKSLEQYGAGRSVLVDKNGVVIAGNKTLSAAAEKGFGVKVVRTDGKQLVVVQRGDIDIESKEGQELALADNRVAEVDLAWDTEQLKALQSEGIDLGKFWFDEELAEMGVIETADVVPNSVSSPKMETCPECGHEFLAGLS